MTWLQDVIGAENAKKVWKEVGPLLIDNRKPEISELESTGSLVWNGRAEDTCDYQGLSPGCSDI